MRNLSNLHAPRVLRSNTLKNSALFFKVFAPRVHRRRRLLRLRIKKVLVGKSYQNKSCSIFGADQQGIVFLFKISIFKVFFSVSLLYPLKICGTVLLSIFASRTMLYDDFFFHKEVKSSNFKFLKTCRQSELKSPW